MDRYDPERNPVMHLVDDAPLALMIFETMETLALSAKDARREDPEAGSSTSASPGWMRMLIGGLIFLLGAGMLLAEFDVEFFFSVIIPALVVVTGAVLLANGVRLRLRAEHAQKDVVRGLALIAGGILLYFFWFLYLVLLLLLLAVWFLSSAAVTLIRVIRTRGRDPQGLVFTTGLGIASLALGYWAFFEPEALLNILIMLLAVIILMAGAFLLLDGYGMQNAAGLMEEREAAGPRSHQRRPATGPRRPGRPSFASGRARRASAART